MTFAAILIAFSVLAIAWRLYSNDRRARRELAKLQALMRVEMEISTTRIPEDDLPPKRFGDFGSWQEMHEYTKRLTHKRVEAWKANREKAASND